MNKIQLAALSKLTNGLIRAFLSLRGMVSEVEPDAAIFFMNKITCPPSASPSGDSRRASPSILSAVEGLRIAMTLLVCLILTTFYLILPSPALAATVIWDGGVSGGWNTGTNWSNKVQ